MDEPRTPRRSGAALLERTATAGRPVRDTALRPVAVVLAVLGTAPLAPVSGQAPLVPAAPDPFRTNAVVGPDNEVRLVYGGPAFGDRSGVRAPLALAFRRRVRDGITVHVAAGTYRGPGPGGGRSTQAQMGGALDVLLLRDRLTVSGHGGLGYLAVEGGHVVTVPVGVGLTVEAVRAARLIPGFISSGGPAIYLWGLPRVEMLHRGLGGASATDVVGAVSFGLAVSSSEGIGILVGLDARADSFDAGLPGLPQWSWGLAFRFRF